MIFCPLWPYKRANVMDTLLLGFIVIWPRECDLIELLDIFTDIYCRFIWKCFHDIVSVNWNLIVIPCRLVTVIDNILNGVYHIVRVFVLGVFAGCEIGVIEEQEVVESR